jgi:hypothetical protein
VICLLRTLNCIVNLHCDVSMGTCDGVVLHHPPSDLSRMMGMCTVVDVVWVYCRASYFLLYCPGVLRYYSCRVDGVHVVGLV